MKLGLIDFYLDEWHANNYPAWLREHSGGTLEAAYAYAVIDSPLPGGRTTEDWCRETGIERMNSVEEIVRLSDGLIVLSPDNCEQHEGLCQIPLRSGKPVYVDKTFAPDGETARRIFKIARDAQTPCYSASALRFAAEYQGVEDVRAIASWGPNGFENYGIHQLEPVLMLMGALPERALYVPGEDSYTLLLAFPGGRVASLTGFEGGGPFAMNIATGREARQVIVKSDYFAAFMQALTRFFRTGRAPVSHEETLAVMDARGAAVRARCFPNQWVDV